MTEAEAKDLLKYIQLGRKRDVACVHQLGNGEFVVILKKRSWHCWTPSDWVRYQEIKSEKTKKKEVQV